MYQVQDGDIRSSDLHYYATTAQREVGVFKKRHYKAIAQLLNAHYLAHSTRRQVADSDIVLDRVIEDFVGMFEEDNPRFNRKKFMEAAGY